MGLRRVATSVIGGLALFAVGFSVGTVVSPDHGELTVRTVRPSLPEGDGEHFEGERGGSFVTVCEQGRVRLFQATVRGLRPGRYRWVIGPGDGSSPTAPVPTEFENVAAYEVLVGSGEPEAPRPDDGVLAVRMALRHGFEVRYHRPHLYADHPEKPPEEEHGEFVTAAPPEVGRDLRQEGPDAFEPCRSNPYAHRRD